MLHLTAALDPASQVPLYEQLYRSIAQEISAGALPAGARMPGKRSLAEALSVSVNTVDGAYQMLAAEGYLAKIADNTGKSASLLNEIKDYINKIIHDGVRLR